MTMDVDIDEELLTEPNEESDSQITEFSILSRDITYSHFFKQFLLKNRPCLIKNITRTWKATELWVRDDMPNFRYLKCTYGHANVTVHDCTKNQREVWKFSDYVNYWESCVKSNRYVPIYYLKDWHLKNEMPKNNFYQVPVYFVSDWLNEYLVDTHKDDYRFVYMGVKGSWTPFHVDVMTSYSWSANICGQKKWLLFPPGEEKHFCDNLGNFPADVSEVYKERAGFEVIQNSGDIMFVPSNWYHQVWNIGDTISINHNWINGCNIKNVWHLLEKNLSEVKIEIRDCLDMEDFLSHCQLMLKATWNGMDFIDFYNFLSHISNKRIDYLKNNRPVLITNNRRLGKRHAIFDLRAVYRTLLLFVKHPDVSLLRPFETIQPRPDTLLNNIKQVINL